MYANTGDGQNFLVQAISYVDPMRYSTELILRRVLAGKPGGDQLLEELGFTWGSATCLVLMIVFTLACFVAGWIIMLWKTREFSNSRLQGIFCCFNRSR